MASLTSSPSSSNSIQLIANRACDDGKKFAELYYEKIDKSRHTIGTLFHDSAILVWNGNNIEGKAAIVSFFESLPTIETVLLSIDAQPVTESIANQAMMSVICSGRMTFGSRTKPFTESFLLAAENNIWKVVSDNYRNY